MTDHPSEWAPAGSRPDSSEQLGRPEPPEPVTASPPALGSGAPPPDATTIPLIDRAGGTDTRAPIPIAEQTRPIPLTPTVSAPTPPRHPLRGWLIAILAVLVLSLATQAVTLALLVPHLVAVTYPTRTVTLVAISTSVNSSATITTPQLVDTRPVTDGQRATFPAQVPSGGTVSLMLAADNPLESSARITCLINDESGRELVNLSRVVGSSPAITCSWTNDGT